VISIWAIIQPLETLNKQLYIFVVSVIFWSCTQKQNTVALNREESKAANDLFFKGLSEKNAGNWESSIQTFSQYLNAQPQSAAVHYEMSRIYREQLNQPLSAIEHAEKAQQIDPANKWYALEYARCLTALENGKAAIKMYEKTSNLDPTWTLPLYEWAEICSFFGDTQKSIDVWNQLEKITGVDPYIIGKKQFNYIELDKPLAAGLELEKLAAAFPGEKRWVIQAAEFYANINEPQKAQAVLEKYPIENSGISYYLQYKSRIKAHSGGTIEDLKLLEKACQYEDVSIDQRVVALAPLVYQKFPDDWLKIIEQCLISTQRIFPNEAKAHSVAGDFYNYTNNLPKAIECFNRTIEIYPAESNVWKALLEIYEYQFKEDPTDYLKRAQEASLQFPFMPEFKAHEVVALSRLGEYASIIQEATEGLGIVTDQVEAEASLYINKIQALYATGQKDAAVQLSKNVLQLPQMQNPIIVFHLAWMNEFFEGNATAIRDRFYNAQSAQKEGSQITAQLIAIKKNESIQADAFQFENWQGCLNAFYYYKKSNNAKSACDALQKAEELMPYNPWISTLFVCP
jgi:tetratricopeptide (TPR) repeat protein